MQDVNETRVTGRFLFGSLGSPSHISQLSIPQSFFKRLSDVLWIAMQRTDRRGKVHDQKSSRIDEGKRRVQRRIIKGRMASWVVTRTKATALVFALLSIPPESDVGVEQVS
jgi:hypothetical protein